MTATKKAMTTAPTHRAEKTAYVVLNVLERAGKEITLLAREGKKRVVAHERRAVSASRPASKGRQV